VLTSLVYADADKAEQFIDKLSKTYRYLLDQREKEAVHISCEIDFLKNFEFLITTRYENKIIIKKDLPGNLENLFLLPHTMLIVFEFIIGSNTMSRAKPLLIEVILKNNFLLIRNSNQSKELPALHLREQFAALLNNYKQANKEISLSTDEFTQQQIIRIPLITI
jgi:LytS/YehU family sensor histidine kinase